MSEKYKPKVTSWRGQDSDRPPEKIYAENDYWENYDDDKDYQEGPFQANYGNGQQTYKWWPRSSNGSVPMWMIARLYATPEEVKALAPFCVCTVCKNNAVMKISFLGRCYLGIESHFSEMLFLWSFSMFFVLIGLVVEYDIHTPIYVCGIITIGLPVVFFVWGLFRLSMGCPGCFGCIKNGHGGIDEQPRERILRGARANRDRFQDHNKLN